MTYRLNIAISKQQSQLKQSISSMSWITLICILLVLVALLATVEVAKATRSEVLVQHQLSLPMQSTNFQPVFFKNTYETQSLAIPTYKLKITDYEDIAPFLQHHGIDVDAVLGEVQRSRNKAFIECLISGSVLTININGKSKDLTCVMANRKVSTASVTTNSPITLKNKNGEKRLEYASGIIRSSLFAAGHKAHVSDRLIMDLAKIFAWDIDFGLDLRPGDSFSIAYESEYKNGEKTRELSIVAAQFINKGKTYNAIQFIDKEGKSSYFSPSGTNLRKSYLRSPVDFSRITSRFNLSRRHPILNRIKAHKGVDYGAPVGTPIKATANGKIIHVGVKGGYGNTLIIQHNLQYKTLYAHLSRYAKGIKAGSRVSQGQIIGYVGQTGLATGPHLHYEFHVNGIHRNPLNTQMTVALAVPQREKPAFESRARKFVSRLTLMNSATLALGDLPVSKL